MKDPLMYFIELRRRYISDHVWVSAGLAAAGVGTLGSEIGGPLVEAVLAVTFVCAAAGVFFLGRRRTEKNRM